MKKGRGFGRGCGGRVFVRHKRSSLSRVGLSSFSLSSIRRVVASCSSSVLHSHNHDAVSWNGPGNDSLFPPCFASSVRFQISCKQFLRIRSSPFNASRVCMLLLRMCAIALPFLRKWVFGDTLLLRSCVRAHSIRTQGVRLVGEAWKEQKQK